MADTTHGRMFLLYLMLSIWIATPGLRRPLADPPACQRAPGRVTRGQTVPGRLEADRPLCWQALHPAIGPGPASLHGITIAGPRHVPPQRRSGRRFRASA